MPASTAEERRHLIIAGLSIFVFALIIRLWFNFVFRHPDASLACDAWEYFSTATAITDAIKAGNFHQITSTAPDGLFAKILAEGPVFPMSLVKWQIFCGLLGIGVPTSGSAVVSLSITSSLTCVMLLFVGKSLWCRKVGMLAGVLAAIYPGFIIATGRILPETIACFMITLSTLLLVVQYKRRPQMWCTFFAGVFSAFLQFARSALLLATALQTAYAALLSVRYRSWRFILMWVAGLGLAIVPWVIFQSNATGKFTPFVDRSSHLNCAVGNNVLAEGWSIEPYPNYGGIEAESLVQIVKRSIKADATGWVELTLGKVARLAKFPWNDFRTPIGIIKFRAQVVFHQILILLAAVGCIVAVPAMRTGGPTNSQNVLGRLLLVGLIAVHFAYVGFVAMPRYFVTAMPLVVLLASAALVVFVRVFALYPKIAIHLLVAASCLWFIARANVAGGTISMFPTLDPTLIIVASAVVKVAFLLYALDAVWRLVYVAKVERVLATVLAFSIALFALPSLCFPLKAHGRWYEKRVNVTAKAPASQTIEVPASSLSQPERTWFLMVDADGLNQLNDLQVTFNGKVLDEPIVPSLSFADLSNKYEAVGDGLQKPFEHIYSALANPSGKSLVDLRQWFFIPVPRDFIIEKNVVEATPVEGEPELFATYKRDVLPSVFRSSWDKAFYGSDWERGLSDTRLEDSLESWNRDYETLRLASQPGRSWQIRLLSIPTMQAETSVDVVQLAPSRNEWKQIGAFKPCTVTPESPQFQSIHLEPLSVGSSSLLRIRGTIEAPHDALESCGVQFGVVNAKNKEVYSGWTPKNLPAKKGNSKFDIAFPVTQAETDLSELHVLLTTTKRSRIIKRPNSPKAEAKFSEITVEAAPLSDLDLSQSRVF